MVCDSTITSSYGPSSITTTSSFSFFSLPMLEADKVKDAYMMEQTIKPIITTNGNDTSYSMSKPTRHKNRVSFKDKDSLVKMHYMRMSYFDVEYLTPNYTNPQSDYETEQKKEEEKVPLGICFMSHKHTIQQKRRRQAQKKSIQAVLKEQCWLVFQKEQKEQQQRLSSISLSSLSTSTTTSTNDDECISKVYSAHTRESTIAAYVRGIFNQRQAHEHYTIMDTMTTTTTTTTSSSSTNTSNHGNQLFNATEKDDASNAVNNSVVIINNNEDTKTTLVVDESPQEYNKNINSLWKIMAETTALTKENHIHHCQNESEISLPPAAA